MASFLIKRVLLTEKGSKIMAPLNQFLVEVDRSATKGQIADEAQARFGVHVLGVRTLNKKGGKRTIRGTRRQVTESTWKCAIVEVKTGERIEMV